jgi:hypothetical protein
MILLAISDKISNECLSCLTIRYISRATNEAKLNQWIHSRLLGYSTSMNISNLHFHSSLQGIQKFNNQINNPISILIFGDSINRLMITEGCNSIGGILQTNWLSFGGHLDNERSYM